MPYLIVIVALAIAGAGAAAAAPPPNDDIASATVIAEPLPFTDAISTSEATTAFDDPDCVGSGPTVWYAFTPSQDMVIRADTFGSDYDTTLSAYVGSPGSLTQIACNDDAGSLQSEVAFLATANETYFFMIGSFASGPGGNLGFTLDGLSPLTADLEIDPTGSFDQQGSATIRGIATCSRHAFVVLNGELKQRVGRRFVVGAFETFFECDGETPWEGFVAGQNGRFVGGHASVALEGLALDPLLNDDRPLSASGVISLRK
jgi:hypothetical protein